MHNAELGKGKLPSHLSVQLMDARHAATFPQTRFKRPREVEGFPPKVILGAEADRAYQTTTQSELANRSLRCEVASGSLPSTWSPSAAVRAWYPDFEGFVASGSLACVGPRCRAAQPALSLLHRVSFNANFRSNALRAEYALPMLAFVFTWSGRLQQFWRSHRSLQTQS